MLDQTVHIPPVDKALSRLGLGCFVLRTDQWDEQTGADLTAAMAAAFRAGINHFDTAASYGWGYSEYLLGQFIADKREQVFTASKVAIDEMDAQAMLEQVNQSLERMQAEMIDLYYIHWPRQGKDMRPLMEGLEMARQQGKLGAIGVSNFSVEQMAQVAEVGQINAHQLGYHLFWRFAERDVIPYCREHGIAFITYGSIAHGILTGKFPRQLQFESNDQRNNIVLFEDEVWPHIYAGVEELKKLAQAANRPLAHLAIRWVLHQEGVHSAMVGARNPQQVEQNVQALEGDIAPDIFARMTQISDEVMKHVPDVGNVYRYYP